MQDFVTKCSFSSSGDDGIARQLARLYRGDGDDGDGDGDGDGGGDGLTVAQ